VRAGWVVGVALLGADPALLRIHIRSTFNKHSAR
jgi:hypothetical protein